MFSTLTWNEKYCIEYRYKNVQRPRKKFMLLRVDNCVIITKRNLINNCQYYVHCYSYLHNFIIRSIVQCLNTRIKICTYVIFFFISIFIHQEVLFTITS